MSPKKNTDKRRYSKGGSNSVDSGLVKRDEA